jgi:hypothetical protein
MEENFQFSRQSTSVEHNLFFGGHIQVIFKNKA